MPENIAGKSTALLNPLTVYKNTIYSTGGTFSSIDSRFQNTNPVVKNNLVKASITTRGNAKPVFTNNVNAEPDMFLDIRKGELHIRETANQVIGHGIPLGSLINDDIDGDKRRLSPDIGADEYVSR